MHAVDGISHRGPPEVFDHGANGNRVQDGTYDYEWDAFNRLRMVTERSTGNVIAEYSYDALDRRVSKSVTHSGPLNGVTEFVYDAEDVVAEYDGSTLLREFVHGPGYDEPLVMDRNVAVDGSAIGAGDERLFYLHDALGSVVALEDTLGNQLAGYLYDGESYVINAGMDGIPWVELVALFPAYCWVRRFQPCRVASWLARSVRSVQALGKVWARSPGRGLAVSLIQVVRTTHARRSGRFTA